MNQQTISLSAVKDLEFLSTPLKWAHIYAKSSSKSFWSCVQVENIWHKRKTFVTNLLFHTPVTLRNIILNNPALFSCNRCGTVTVQYHSHLLQIPAGHTSSFCDSLKQCSFWCACSELHKNPSFLFNFTAWFSVLATRILAFKIQCTYLRPQHFQMSYSMKSNAFSVSFF